MDGELPASKHLGVAGRRQRFDPESKYGGRAGHTLVRARPRSHIGMRVPGYADFHLSVGPSGVDPYSLRNARDPRSHHAASLITELEGACSERAVQRSRLCPDVVVTEYTVEESDSEDLLQAGPTVYSVTSLRTGSNVRMFPRGFDFCHLGCSKCGKNRGNCVNAENSTKMRRLRFQKELAQDLHGVGDVGDWEDGAVGKVESVAEREGWEDPEEEARRAAELARCRAWMAGAGRRRRRGWLGGGLAVRPSALPVGPTPGRSPGGVCRPPPAPEAEAEAAWMEGGASTPSSDALRDWHVCDDSWLLVAPPQLCPEL